MNQCDILHVTFSSRGRDINIIEPILSYMEIRYNLRIKRCCVRDYVINILKYKPKSIITDISGAMINVHAVKFAQCLGIKIIGITGEGDFQEGQAEAFFWGWDKDRIFYPDVQLLWSNRVLEIIHKHIEGSRAFPLYVTGATGFDCYKILKFKDKDTFLRQYNKEKYSKLVTFAGWGFDCYDIGEFHKKSLLKLRAILKKMIESNTDILFVLKYHPALREKRETEFWGLDIYDNVLTIENQENIADLINVSDFWMGYESTTCLEAWLLNKETFLINPEGTDFERSIVSTGSVIVENYNDTQGIIDEFYKSGHIKKFKGLEENRRKVIEQVIQFDDGKNHIRAGNCIYKLLKTPYNKNKSINNIWFWEKLFIEIMKFAIYGSCLKLIPWVKSRFPFYSSFDNFYSTLEREEEHKKFTNALNAFYKNIRF